MSPRQVELSLRRQRLQIRAARQRESLAADFAALPSSELPLTLADAVIGVSALVNPSFFHSVTGVWGGAGKEDPAETSALSVLSSRASSRIFRASWTAILRNSSKEGDMEGVETT